MIKWNTDKEFKNYLKEKYPVFFSGLGKGWRDGGIGNCSCDRGWWNLIDVVASQIESLGKPVKAEQVKEKFGGIRIYFSIETVDENEIYNLHDIVQSKISVVEALSYRICELCGAPGQTTNSGGYWLKTVCEECDAKRREKNSGNK